VNDCRTHVGTKEVARRLGVSAEHVGDLIRAGLLRASNVGLGRRAQWRVAIADLDSFLSERTNQAKVSSGASVVGRAGRRGCGGRRSRSVGDEEFV